MNAVIVMNRYINRDIYPDYPTLDVGYGLLYFTEIGPIRSIYLEN